MLIHLHKQATTTPKVRAAIQASDEPASTLAERFGTTEQTVYKWKHRDSVHDRSHTPYRLQTTLTPAQEAVAVVLRKTLLVSIDDLLAVVREFLNPEVSRSGLDRCLRRHGVGNLRDLQAQSPRPKHKAFRAYEPGYLHVDVKYLPQMADEASRRYLFVAIDRATRWVFVRIYKSKTAANARRFLRDLERACPMRIRTILTDNGKEFTDRLFGLRKRSPTGKHEFDLLCADLGIEHRLAPPQHPQTNGMVERFNGRIEEVLQSHHFHSGEDLETTLHRYALLYNQQLPQSALGSKTPLQAMKDWHKMKPELFRKQPYHLPGCDTYVQPEIGMPDTASVGTGLIVSGTVTVTTHFGPNLPPGVVKGVLHGGLAAGALYGMVDIVDAAHNGTPQDVAKQLWGLEGNIVGGLYGAEIGALVGGPLGALALGALGALMGEKWIENQILANRSGVAYPGVASNWVGGSFWEAEGLGPPHCFLATTPIAISPTKTRPISQIRVGDTVLAFDPAADLGRGALVPRKVVRLYRNTTEEWVKLTWTEGGEAKELIATPGHHFLDRFGSFPTIEDMLENGKATVVLASGELTTGEVGNERGAAA